MKVRRTIAVLVAATVLAMLAPLAASAEEVRDVGTYRIGHRFNVRPHIGQQSYDGKRHVIAGTVGLSNSAERARKVRCLIVITFQDMDGTAKVKRTDEIHSRVPPNATRHPNYRVQLRDTNHRFANNPVHKVGHCHLLG